MRVLSVLRRLHWVTAMLSLPSRLRWRRWVGFTCVLLLFTLLMDGDVLDLSPTARATAASSFSVEGWVVRNVTAKALGGLFDFLPGRGHSEEEREDAV